MDKVFVDSHCHLFSIQDVPLYGTLAPDAEKVNTIKVLFDLLTGAHDHIECYKELILSFERESDVQLEWLVKQVNECPVAKKHGKLLIPLIMDFDLVKPKIKNVLTQQKKLKLATIKKAVFLKNKSCKVLPFLGFDLRKLERNGGVSTAQELWKNADGLRKAERSYNYKAIENGRPIGFKIYPPISSTPYPKDLKRRKLFLDFFSWCLQTRIPITTHCQRGAYAVTQKDQVRARTTPKNWEKILATSNHSFNGAKVNLGGLHLNLAHFGGVDDVSDAIASREGDTLAPDTWVATIIRLLKNYPNTYSDISGYDFSTPSARKNLIKIIELDFEGKLGKGHLLKDKLLWGSDVPMVVHGPSYRKEMMKDGACHYKYLYKAFQETIKASERLTKAQKTEIEEAMTFYNPMRFLF